MARVCYDGISRSSRRELAYPMKNLREQTSTGLRRRDCLCSKPGWSGILRDGLADFSHRSALLDARDVFLDRLRDISSAFHAEIIRDIERQRRDANSGIACPPYDRTGDPDRFIIKRPRKKFRQKLRSKVRAHFLPYRDRQLPCFVTAKTEHLCKTRLFRRWLFPRRNGVHARCFVSQRSAHPLGRGCLP